jgi:two-component system CheB/CheR fusion protein
MSVFESLKGIEREIASSDGRWYIVRVLPYRSNVDQIGGIVLTFVDITSRREAEAGTSLERRADASCR